MREAKSGFDKGFEVEGGYEREVEEGEVRFELSQGEVEARLVARLMVGYRRERSRMILRISWDEQGMSKCR
jgi:hypothetical protein